MDINNRQLIKYEKEVAEMSDHAIPIAIQQTLNNTARTAWKEGRKNTDSDFTNRNTWTKRTQTYQTTKDLNVDRMETVAGSTAGYLAKQEEGFTRRSSKGGVWVPTAEAAGESGHKRTKPIRAKYRRSRIKIRRKRLRKPASAAQARLFKLVNAVKGNGYYWGKLGSTNGMWQVEGNTENGRLTLTSVRLLYSANKKTVRTPKKEWHEPAVKMARDRMGMEYYKAVKRQLKRLRRKYGRR